MRINTYIKMLCLTAILLFVPFFLMVFNIPLYDPGSGYGVINWDIADFILMGLLIFSFGSLIILVSQHLKTTTSRTMVAILVLVAFLWLWAELAVGIFTTWGS